MKNKYEILITLFILSATIIFFEYSTVDLQIQNYLFDFESKQWLVSKHEKIPKLIFYDGIKIVYFVFLISLMISLLFLSQSKILLNYHKGLKILFFSALLIPLSINGLKGMSNIPCPSDLSYYDGNQPYTKLFDQAERASSKNIRCYPAGHASGGFALMSLFFLFYSTKNKIIALGSAISFGWVVGFYKMLIGDHFLSHTLVTMEISWLLILIIKSIIYYENVKRIKK